jgi:hypothetical protein
MAKDQSSNWALPARIFHAFSSALINTEALARCTDALWRGKLFQQFVTRSEKPLKRLADHCAPLHRAKAPVLMRAGGLVCEMSVLDVRPEGRVPRVSIHFSK